MPHDAAAAHPCARRRSRTIIWRTGCKSLVGVASRSWSVAQYFLIRRAVENLTDRGARVADAAIVAVPCVMYAVLVWRPRALKSARRPRLRVACGDRLLAVRPAVRPYAVFSVTWRSITAGALVGEVINTPVGIVMLFFRRDTVA